MNANQPANAVRTARVALSEVKRFDLACLFNTPEAPAPVAAQKSVKRNGEIITLARSVRRLAPAA